MDERDEQSAHDRMARYEQLAEQERQYRAKKRNVLDQVGQELSAVVEAAIDSEGASAAVESTGDDGKRLTIGARLDRAALIAAVSDSLPDGFSIKGINDDGTLTIEWSRREQSPEQRAMVILEAIVVEEIVTDADEFIIEAPSRSAVIERATALGVPSDLAGERLQRLDDLGKVDIEEGQVFPGAGRDS